MTSTAIDLGDYAKDSVTDFAGIVSGVTDTLFSCRRITIERTELTKDGKLTDMLTFDEPRVIKNTRKTNFLIATGQDAEFDKLPPLVALGDYVEDMINGYRGHVDAITTCLHGCRRVTVSTIKKNKEGSLDGDHPILEEQRLKKIKVDGHANIKELLPKPPAAPAPAPEKPVKPPGGPRSVGMPQLRSSR